MDPEPATDTRVFERPVPVPLRILVVATACVMFAVPPFFAFGGYDSVEDALPFLKDPDSFPLGDPGLTLFLGLTFLPGSITLGLILWLRRRYGRAEVSATEIRFEAPFMPRALNVPLNRVDEVRETPWGLVLRDRSRSSWEAFLAPLLIPAGEDQDFTEVLSALRRASH